MSKKILAILIQILMVLFIIRVSTHYDQMTFIYSSFFIFGSLFLILIFHIYNLTISLDKSFKKILGNNYWKFLTIILFIPSFYWTRVIAKHEIQKITSFDPSYFTDATIIISIIEFAKYFSLLILILSFAVGVWLILMFAFCLYGKLYSEEKNPQIKLSKNKIISLNDLEKEIHSYLFNFKIVLSLSVASILIIAAFYYSRVINLKLLLSVSFYEHSDCGIFDRPFAYLDKNSILVVEENKKNNFIFTMYSCNRKIYNPDKIWPKPFWNNDEKIIPFLQ